MNENRLAATHFLSSELSDKFPKSQIGCFKFYLFSAHIKQFFSTDESTDGTENGPLNEVDYSNVDPLIKTDQNLDYVLKNDNKPCVVVYHKMNVPNTSIFGKTASPTQKKNLGNSIKGIYSHVTFFLIKYLCFIIFSEGGAKERQSTNRYETRSKTLEKRTGRVLRSNKL